MVKEKKALDELRIRLQKWEETLTSKEIAMKEEKEKSFSEKILS